MTHSYQDRAGFHKLLASMDLNLLLSFGEAYNMTFMESWMLGVPCLTSATTDLHPALDFTRVASYDEPNDVWYKIDQLLADPRVEYVRRIFKDIDAENEARIKTVLEQL